MSQYSIYKPPVKFLKDITQDLSRKLRGRNEAAIVGSFMFTRSSRAVTTLAQIKLIADSTQVFVVLDLIKIVVFMIKCGRDKVKSYDK